MVEAVFRYCTFGLLLIAVVGIAQPKQPGVVDARRFRQRREKVQLRPVLLLERVA